MSTLEDLQDTKDELVHAASEAVKLRKQADSMKKECAKLVAAQQKAGLTASQVKNVRAKRRMAAPAAAAAAVLELHAFCH
jgi:hypothetical protein